MHEARAEPNPFTNFQAKIDRHWREYRPRMYAELEQRGELEAAIKAADEQTFEAHVLLTQQGLDFWRAWEAVKEEWAYLPAEEDEDDEETE